MKFLITSGRKKGNAFELVEEDIRIGRKKDNQVILDDESVSGYHARICLKGDEVTVEDCDSVNGIEVNGKPVKKATLAPKDVITIGMTQITVLEDEKKAESGKEGKEEKGEAEPAPRPSKEKGDGKKKKAAPSSTAKTVTAIVLVALVAAFAAALPLLKRTIRPTPSSAAPFVGGSPTEYTRSIFRLRYEKAQVSAKNISRYEMRIVNGTLSIAIDDIKQERHMRRNKTLESTAIARIRDSIQDQQIFSLPAQIEGKSTDVWDSSILEVVAGGQIHRVQVLNRLPPDNFKKVCTLLEDFVGKEFNLPGGTMMDSEQLKKCAQDAHQRGRQLAEQHSVKAENLYNAIKAFDEAIWYLETIEPKPPVYAEAIKGRQSAVDMLDKQIEDHRFRATKAVQLREWRTAAMELRLLLEKLPDQTDKRNQEAQVQLLSVEQHLRPK